MEDVAGDLAVTRNLVIPAAELQWRFSRSSGPGGQSVNTTDSRVELCWDPRTTGALTDQQRSRALVRLGGRLAGDGLVVVASDDRSQWQNRRTARTRLARMVAEALAPPPRRRRRTRPSRGSVERRIAGKRRRADLKRNRSRPDRDD